MLTTQEHGQVRGPRRGGPASLAELRHHLANLSGLTSRDQQRLLELAARVSRIQSLGGEYARVGLSERAGAALSDAAGGA
jgi:hypothetical protein